MSSLLGYFLCLLALMPAFSTDPFFWLIGKSDRPHDLLGLFRVAVQTLANVTSPIKMGLMLAVVTGVFLVRSMCPSRLSALLVVGIAGLVSSMQVLLLGRSAGMGAAILLVPSTVSTFASVWWGLRQTLTNAPF